MLASKQFTKQTKEKSMSVNQIVTELMSGTLTNDDIEKVAQALKYARSQVAKTIRRQLSPGVSVKFYHPKQNFYIAGTVNRIKQKYVLVDTAQGRYNVPANLLETV
jgi:N-acetylmuramic acid 6-phosphate (MurNAc-6-P) etherase